MRKTTKRLVSFLTAVMMTVTMLPGVGAATPFGAEYDNDDNVIIVSGLTTGVDAQAIIIENSSDEIIAMEEYSGAEIAESQSIPVLETIAAGTYDVTASCDGVIDTCQVVVEPGVKAIYNATAGTVTVINIPASESTTTVTVESTSAIVAMEEYDNAATERVLNVLPLANGTYTVSVGVVESATAVVYGTSFVVTGSTVTPAPTTAPTEAPTETPSETPTEAPSQLPDIDIPDYQIINEFYFDDDDNMPWACGSIAAGTVADKDAANRVYAPVSSPSRVCFAGNAWNGTTGLSNTTLQFDVYVPSGSDLALWGASGGHSDSHKNRPGVGIKSYNGTTTIGVIEGYTQEAEGYTTVVPNDEWVRVAVNYNTTEMLYTVTLNGTVVGTTALTGNHTSTPNDFSISITPETNAGIYLDNVIFYDPTAAAPTEAPTETPTETPTAAPVPTGNPDVPNVDSTKLLYEYTFNNGATAPTVGLFNPGNLKVYGDDTEHGTYETANGVGGKSDKVLKITRNDQGGAYPIRVTSYSSAIAAEADTITVEAQFYIPSISGEKKAGMTMGVYTNTASDSTATKAVLSVDTDGVWKASAANSGTASSSVWTRDDGTGIEGKWHNIAVVATRSSSTSANDGSFKFYLNGELVHTVTGLTINTFMADVRWTSANVSAGTATNVVQYMDNLRAYTGEYIGQEPIETPTVAPTAAPTAAPSEAPTTAPTAAPTETPTVAPTATPTPKPLPTVRPGGGNGGSSIVRPTVTPTQRPTGTGNGGYVGTITTEVPEFKDMAGYEWAETAVTSLARVGVVNGRTDDTFEPAASVTRAEFTKMVCGAMGLQPKTNADQVFTDVSGSHWAYGYIATAAELGVVNGVTDTEFAPNDLITREQMAAILYRAIVACGAEGKLADGTAVSFVDYSTISDYAKAAVDALSAAGVINGVTDTTFVPKANANRAQAASIIYQYFKAIGTV